MYVLQYEHSLQSAISLQKQKDVCSLQDLNFVQITIFFSQIDACMSENFLCLFILQCSDSTSLMCVWYTTKCKIASL